MPETKVPKNAKKFDACSEKGKNIVKAWSKIRVIQKKGDGKRG